jgi:hypothetical protein
MLEKIGWVNRLGCVLNHATKLYVAYLALDQFILTPLFFLLFVKWNILAPELHPVKFGFATFAQPRF